MSSLTNNLQKIYNTKLQIKEVIGTSSDVFEDYPGYISAAIDSGLNWDDVATYGYIVPAGTVNVSANGTVDVSSYANAYVDVESSSSEGYPTHTISDVTDWNYRIDINMQGEHPCIAVAEVETLDGDSGYWDPLVVSSQFYGYCYPASCIIEENPAFTEEALLVTYVNSYKQRIYTYNSLPDFNTYRGYTYSYEYIENEDTVTYEFTYDERLLYKTNVSLVDVPQDSFARLWEPYGIGVAFNYYTVPTGLRGYYDSEWMDGIYYNAVDLHIATVERNSTYSQFTSTYHNGASYTTPFDVTTLRGHSWNIVVDGYGWLVDIINKTGDANVSNILVTDGDIETASYWDNNTTYFTQEIELNNENSVFSGLYATAEIAGNYYNININSIYAQDVYDPNNAGEVLSSGSITTFAETDSNSANLYVDMDEINNHYSIWTLTMYIDIPYDFYYNSKEATVRWTFSGTANE